MKVLGLALFSLTLALGMACGNSSTESSGGSTSERPDTATPAKSDTTSSTGTASAKPAAGGTKTVGVLSPALTSTFHKTLIDGFTKQGEANGWKVVSQAPDKEDNFTAQIDEVQAMVQNKVAAITICAINPEAIVGAVEEANKAGIPVFVHNSLTEMPAPAKVEAYIGYDQRKAGKLCGDYVVEQLKKKNGGQVKGKVFILDGVPGFHTTERAGGFKDALKAYPDIQIAGEQSAEWLKDKGMNVASAALTSTPDIDAFFGCSDAMMQGAAQAAKEANKTVITIGIDGNPDTFEDIKSGVVTATCAVFPKNMGKVDADTMKAFLDGKKVEKKVETEIKIVDKSNVEEASKQ